MKDTSAAPWNRQVAIHEAGHVVMALLSGGPRPECVAIGSGGVEGVHGYVRSEPYDVPRDNPKPLALWRIRGLLAGPVAQMRVAGPEGAVQGDDFERARGIARLVDSTPGGVERVVFGILVDVYRDFERSEVWHAIEYVADELERARLLEGEELARVHARALEILNTTTAAVGVSTVRAENS